MAELTCIICPNGCRLKVDDNLNVSGNRCPRGAIYGKQEVTNPTRTVTSTVRCDSSFLKVCPVKTKDPIPKGKIFEAMKEINACFVKVPCHIGDVVKSNIAGTGVDLVVSRDIER
jgi:CxxC motif-containing protein